jgi:hypothetical protein
MTPAGHQFRQPSRLGRRIAELLAGSRKLVAPHHAGIQPVDMPAASDAANHADMRPVDLRNHVGDQVFRKSVSIWKFLISAPFEFHLSAFPVPRWEHIQRRRVFLTQVKSACSTSGKVRTFHRLQITAESEQPLTMSSRQRIGGYAAGRSHRAVGARRESYSSDSNLRENVAAMFVGILFAAPVAFLYVGCKLVDWVGVGEWFYRICNFG